MNPITKIVLNGEMSHTPARVNMQTGVMEVNREFLTYPKPVQMFILCHEYAHRWAGTRDEIKADELAFRWYSNLGYPLSQSVVALATILDGNKPYHLERTKSVYGHAKALDDTVYKPHASYTDLSNPNNRKEIMRKHRNAQAKAIAQAIRAKKYDEAAKLIQAEIVTVPPGSCAERTLFSLQTLVGKAAKVAESKTGKAKKPMAEFGFTSDSDFESFEGELAEVAGEIADIANFNEDFAEYAQEVETYMQSAGFTDDTGEIVNFLNEDHAYFEDFTQDVEDFADDHTGDLNVFASAKGEKKVKRQERKDNREKRKQQRADNRAKIADAKAKAKVTRANAVQTKADAKKSLADKGIVNPNKFDLGKLTEVGGSLLGTAANVASGGAIGSMGGALGDMMGGGTENLRTPAELPVSEPPVAKEPEPKKGLPVWAWVAIGVGVVAVLGGVAWFITKKK